MVQLLGSTPRRGLGLALASAQDTTLTNHSALRTWPPLYRSKSEVCTLDVCGDHNQCMVTPVVGIKEKMPIRLWGASQCSQRTVAAIPPYQE
jgi:hypothetical protein